MERHFCNIFSAGKLIFPGHLEPFSREAGYRRQNWSYRVKFGKFVDTPVTVIYDTNCFACVTFLETTFQSSRTFLTRNCLITTFQRSCVLEALAAKNFRQKFVSCLAVALLANCCSYYSDAAQSLGERLMKRMLVLLVMACVAWAAVQRASAVTVTIDPSATWLGFMNVSELPANGGAYVFGGPWGTADLVATFSGPVLTLAPNTVDPPDGLNDAFWYNPDGSGNKSMAASMYVEDDSLVGQSVTFTGQVLSNSFTSAHSTIAFIKDFASDYSSSVVSSVTLTSPGVFSISLNTIPLPGRHVQFGFETTGVNVWHTDVAPFGSLQVAAVPEPASLAIGGIALLGLLVVRGRR